MARYFVEMEYSAEKKYKTHVFLLKEKFYLRQNCFINVISVDAFGAIRHLLSFTIKRFRKSETDGTHQ